MVVSKVTRVVNSGSVKRSLKKRYRPKGRHAHRSANGPAFLMTLGPMNPKKRSPNVATKKKKYKKSHAHRASSVRSAKKRSSSRGKVSISAKSLMALARGKKNKGGRRRGAHRSRNPMASSISLSRPSKIMEAGVAILVGVAGTKAIVSALPDKVTSSPLYSSIAAAAIALGIWWTGSMLSPEFGAAAGLGGIAEAGSIALNGFLPDIGAKLALSGVSRGRLGDFVPGSFTVPQNPVLDAATGLPKRQTMVVSAYPKAYQTA